MKTFIITVYIISFIHVWFCMRKAIIDNERFKITLIEMIFLFTPIFNTAISILFLIEYIYQFIKKRKSSWSIDNFKYKIFLIKKK